MSDLERGLNQSSPLIGSRRGGCRWDILAFVCSAVSLTLGVVAIVYVAQLAGSRSPQGAMGPPGMMGPPGVTGAQGIPGAPGPAYPTGITYLGITADQTTDLVAEGLIQLSQSVQTWSVSQKVTWNDSTHTGTLACPAENPTTSCTFWLRANVYTHCATSPNAFWYKWYDATITLTSTGYIGITQAGQNDMSQPYAEAVLQVAAGGSRLVQLRADPAVAPTGVTSLTTYSRATILEL